MAEVFVASLEGIEVFEVTVADQIFVAQLVIGVRMYRLNLKGTCLQVFVAFVEEAFVAVQAVVLFEVLTSVDVATAEEYGALEQELDGFRLTIVDGFGQAFALIQVFASCYLEELRFR